MPRGFRNTNFPTNNVFNISKIHKKIQTTSHQYQKLYGTPHDMVHVPAKFRENTAMRFLVTVRKLNVTEGQTGGGGGVPISPVPGVQEFF